MTIFISDAEREAMRQAEADAAGGDVAVSQPGAIGGFDEDFTVPVFLDTGLGLVTGLAESAVDFGLGPAYNPDAAITREQAPRYFEGAEWSLFAGDSPEQIVRRQQDLVDAGFLDPADIVTPGRWFQAEADAMADVMTIANGSGMTWDQVIASGIQGGDFRAMIRGRRGAGRGGGGGGARRPTIRLSSAEDLRLIFRDVARQRSGGVFVDGTQINQMVEAYQGIERREQERIIAGAAVVEGAPSPEAFAASQLDEFDPGGAEANRFAQMADIMTNLVGQV